MRCPGQLRSAAQGRKYTRFHSHHQNSDRHTHTCWRSRIPRPALRWCSHYAHRCRSTRCHTLFLSNHLALTVAGGAQPSCTGSSDCDLGASTIAVTIFLTIFTNIGTNTLARSSTTLSGGSSGSDGGLNTVSVAVAADIAADADPIAKARTDAGVAMALSVPATINTTACRLTQEYSHGDARRINP